LSNSVDRLQRKPATRSGLARNRQPLCEQAPCALSLTWPVLPHFVATPEELAAAAADLFEAIQTGIVNVDPTRIYAFDELVQAHRDMEQRKTVGAVVLHVD
jgi:NADPH2:quinone reductase